MTIPTMTSLIEEYTLTAGKSFEQTPLEQTQQLDLINMFIYILILLAITYMVHKVFPKIGSLLKHIKITKSIKVLIHLTKGLYAVADNTLFKTNELIKEARLVQAQRNTKKRYNRQEPIITQEELDNALRNDIGSVLLVLFTVITQSVV